MDDYEYHPTSATVGLIIDEMIKIRRKVGEVDNMLELTHVHYRQGILTKIERKNTNAALLARRTELVRDYHIREEQLSAEWEKCKNDK